MITFNNILKSYGTQVLFENVTFNINKREKIGLVGRNGYGKTTLLKMITGEEEPDSGKLVIPNNYKIGFLRQHISFRKDSVIEEAIVCGQDGEPPERWKAEKVLAGLGFSDEMMNIHPADLSGGYQIRIMLAKLLLTEPDMLLLDEPTNYLDILSIRWLRNFLTDWQGELVLITHDKEFMDSIITHTVGIHRKRICKVAGGTEKFYSQILKDEEIYEKTRINDEQKRKELEEYITRFRAKARLAGLVQSRKKTLDKMTKKNQLEKIKNLEFSFRYKPVAAKHIMHCNNITFGYSDDKPLIKDLSLIVGNKDKIGVIGKNGRGKSTLLKILAGEIMPQAGSVLMHNGSVNGCFTQTNISSLDINKTIEEEIQSVSDDLDRTSVRNICGAMLFPQDEALKKISVLSGGEKSRVMLGKIIATPVNILMLDEPTNHLDMDSCDALTEALNDFNGAVIVVTHNEMLLRMVATRLIVFQSEYPFVFEGSYDEFIEKIGWTDETPKKKPSGNKINKKDIRRLRSELNVEKNKTLKPLNEKIYAIEENICNMEAEISSLNDKAIELANKGGGKTIADLQIRISYLKKEIDLNFDELEKTSNLLEEKISSFNEKLALLGDDN